jgi:hypothetical protein
VVSQSLSSIAESGIHGSTGNSMMQELMMSLRSADQHLRVLSGELVHSKYLFIISFAPATTGVKIISSEGEQHGKRT